MAMHRAIINHVMHTKKEVYKINNTEKEKPAYPV